MAIALYSFTDVTGGSGTVDASSGANRIMIFVGATASGSDSITAVSWNSESFTKSGSVQSGTSRFTSVWYLIPSGTGSHTLSTTGTTSSSGVMVYTGVKTSTSPKNWTSATGSADTSKALSITANDGDWLVGGGISNVGALVEGSNTTIRSSAGSIIQVDSNGVASPTALNFTMSIGAYALSGLAIEPSPAFTLAMGQGSYTYTGQNLLFVYGHKLVIAAGSFALTGYDLLMTLYQKWIKQALNTSSMSNGTKNSSNWTDDSKNSSSMNNQTKN